LKSSRLIAASMGPERDRRGRWLFHIRYAAWRRDVAQLHELDEAVHGVAGPGAAGGGDGPQGARRVSGAHRAAELFEWMDMVMANFPLGRRLHQWLLQHQAELAGYFGRTAEVLAALRRAEELDIFDLAWFDGCPLLAEARRDPGFAAIRAGVQRRAEEIVDAMWGA
jgi:hypothetical protein